MKLSRKDLRKIIIEDVKNLDGFDLKDQGDKSNDPSFGLDSSIDDLTKKAEEESSAPRSFRTWYESVFSWIAAFAYKGGGRPGKYQLALTMNT